MQIVFFPAHAQANGDDDEKIEEKDKAIDNQPAIHSMLLMNDESRMSNDEGRMDALMAKCLYASSFLRHRSFILRR